MERIGAWRWMKIYKASHTEELEGGGENGKGGDEKN